MIAVDVYHEYEGYTTQVADTSQGASSQMDGTIPTLVRLDMIIAMIIYCLREDNVYMVDGHCQNRYYDAFSSILTVAFSEPIGTVVAFVLQ